MNYPYYEVPIYDDFHEMLCGLYHNYKKKIAIRYLIKDQIKELTYQELIRQIGNIYHFYKTQNISRKHIGILSENRYEYIPLYLATTFENVIAPLDRELDAAGLRSCFEKFDLEVLLYTNKTKEKALKAAEGLSIKTIHIDEAYAEMAMGKYETSAFLEGIKNTDKDRFCVLASTSGTDGKMKGVMLSQYNVAVNVRGTLENNILKSPTLSLLPMNHTYGFNPGILATIYNGTTVCINSDLKYLLRDIKAFDPFFFEAVPLIIEGMYDNILREVKHQGKEETFACGIKISQFLLKFGIDIRHLLFGNILNKRLRLVVSGGAALKEEYVRKYDELGIKLLNGYGLTECSPTIAVSREYNNVPGSSGTIMNHIEVKIAGDGEILVKGPNVMLGYYKDVEATEACMEDGYFKTGDLGYVEDKVIFVTGRKKNLIILKNGKNFSPEAVENRLLKLPYVKECLVVPKVKNGIEIIVAMIYPEGSTDTLQEDIDRLNEGLPNYMHIDEYEILSEEFEKTSSRKIKRSQYAD